jgi:phage shock protein A
MSDRKPGIFSRLRTSISSALTDAVDSVSDPGQEVALMLDDLAAQIQSSEGDLKQALVEKKMMERKVEELRQQEASWQKKAEQALRLGDEALAREALKKKADYSMQAGETERAMHEQAALVDSMHRHLKESKAKLKSLNLRRGSLMAQARAAKKGVAPGTLGDGGTLSRLDDIENKIAALEALNEVSSELSNEVKEAELDAKLESLAGESELDNALEQLKAKMGQTDQKVLPSGRDED